MNTKFKIIGGVCEKSEVLAQIDGYLKENARDVKKDIVHVIGIDMDGSNATAEIYGGCYAHENSFEIKIISKDEEIGYCEVAHSQYL